MSTTAPNISSHLRVQRHCLRINLKQMCLFSTHLLVVERSWQIITQHDRCLCDQIWGSILVFTWTGWEEQQKTSANITSISTKVYPQDLKKKIIIINKKGTSATGWKDSCRCSLRRECFNEDLKIICVVNTVITQWRHGYGNAVKPQNSSRI